MGWVGAGVLIATAAYFLYRYPPRSWAEPRSFAPPEPTPDAPVAAATADDTVPRKHGSGVTTPSIETKEEEDDSQSTPKAAASSAPPPVLAVPTFSLESGERETSQPALVPSSSQPINGTAKQAPSTNRDNAAPKFQPPPQPSLAPPPKPQPSSLPPKATTTGASSLMPPPPVPRLRSTPQTNRLAPTSSLQPPRLSGNSLRPPPSAAAAQRGLAPTNSGSRLSNSTLAPTQVSLKKSSGKVVLEPGFSPLDWAARAANPKNNLRGEGLPPGLLRVTPSMLKEQHGRKGRDAWTSYHGKVYNISPYAPYHPGGKGELLRGAGKDSAQLFQEIHPWVNWEGILGECLVGILVSEHDTQAENALDAMD
ncbi:Cytochrome b5 [Penicillium griseofulvum]|uniref:Cytochrome b5 n=1 Tax=Penicillium patulum TaxID=5078 RepID=A0A135L8Y3_PENPA|nr:Cytochrome b5 [Penicillium griseofulvum]KXG45426.1 Cytochrome b5 [Penicillium griseofulvum]